MYPIATKDDVISVLGHLDQDIIDSWVETEARLFHKHGQPYGLISVVPTEHDPRHLFIAATATMPEQPFTRGMLKYILNHSKDNSISVITDEPEYFDIIMDALDGHGFSFNIVEGALYSTKVHQIHKGGQDGS